MWIHFVEHPTCQNSFPHLAHQQSTLFSIHLWSGFCGPHQTPPKKKRPGIRQTLKSLWGFEAADFISFGGPTAKMTDEKKWRDVKLQGFPALGSCPPFGRLISCCHLHLPPKSVHHRFERKTQGPGVTLPPQTTANTQLFVTSDRNARFTDWVVQPMWGILESFSR